MPLAGAPGAAPGKVALQARVNERGSVSIAGPVGLDPVSAQLDVDIRSLGLLPAQPYFTEYVNAVIASGQVSAKGKAIIELPPGKPSRIQWRGDAGITEFSALSKPSNRDLLRWKSLQVKGIDVDVDPLKVKIDDVALDDFFGRLILSQQGRLNLQDLLVKSDEASSGRPGQGGQPTPAGPKDLSKPGSPSAPVGASASGSAATASAAGSSPATGSAAPGSPGAASATGNGSGTATGSAPPAAAEVANSARELSSFGSAKSVAPPAPPPSGPPPNVSVGRITLSNGNIDFSDFFVQPNYSANLTSLRGSVSRLSPQTTGEVTLKGRVNNAGTLDISGRLNPFSTAMSMDIQANAADIDLPRLSPYSIKYIGYGIEKGKLSAQVNYKIVDRQLTATNKVVLDQFTLGDKVPSPTAVNLPVQFALSLLKDRNGVIDVELPISGSIDDPQFSVGGIILRLIGNLIVKAVTSPFSLLTGLAGGSSAQLSQIPFPAGQATVDAQAADRLGKLAKALQDRPALKVDVSGRADTAVDSAPLNRLRLERRLKSLKVKETVAAGNESGDALDKVKLTADERLKYLRQLYRAADFDKPKNAIGLTKDVPAEEMEQMLLEHSTVGERQLTDLANRRAQAAKDWLSENGKVELERLYITSSRVDAPAPKGDEQGGQSSGAPSGAPSDAPSGNAPGASSGNASGNASGGKAAPGPSVTGVALTLK